MNASRQPPAEELGKHAGEAPAYDLPHHRCREKPADGRLPRLVGHGVADQQQVSGHGNPEKKRAC
jgi:hypothetical protein